MDRTASILVCFAVPEEAKFFKPAAAGLKNVQTLVTGIGQRNAEAAIRSALAKQGARLVLSCGFAGGLRPELATGAVLFASEGSSRLQAALTQAGAKPARFHCSTRIIPSAKEKQELWKVTGADAVEMESQFICGICHGQNIPSATVRVILDTADENLPLDFNQLMNAQQQMSYGKLATALMKSPGKIPGLLRLQKQTRLAGRALAEALVRAIAILEST